MTKKRPYGPFCVKKSKKYYQTSEALAPFNIKLIDHVVICDDCYYSFCDDCIYPA